jgi:hypothetical protein
MGGIVHKDGRVVAVPEYKSKVYTAGPILWWFSFFKALFQVKRGAFNIVTSGEHKYAPRSVSIASL